MCNCIKTLMFVHVYRCLPSKRAPKYNTKDTITKNHTAMLHGIVQQRGKKNQNSHWRPHSFWFSLREISPHISIASHNKKMHYCAI